MFFILQGLITPIMEDYPINKSYRIKNDKMKKQFNRIKEKHEEEHKRGNYGAQSVIKMAFNLAEQKLDEIEEENQKLSDSVP